MKENCKNWVEDIVSPWNDFRGRRVARCSSEKIRFDLCSWSKLHFLWKLRSIDLVSAFSYVPHWVSIYEVVSPFSYVPQSIFLVCISVCVRCHRFVVSDCFHISLFKLYSRFQSSNDWDSVKVYFCTYLRSTDKFWNGCIRENLFMLIFIYEFYEYRVGCCVRSYFLIFVYDFGFCFGSLYDCVFLICLLIYDRTMPCYMLSNGYVCLMLCNAIENADIST